MRAIAAAALVDPVWRVLERSAAGQRLLKALGFSDHGHHQARRRAGAARLALTSRARMPAATLGWALAAHRRWVAPRVRAEQRRWAGAAAAIPDPALREAALAALRGKGANAEATGVFALLAPRAGRAGALRAIAALQTAVDYLDTLGERPLEDPLGAGLALHAALPEALDPSGERSRWYRSFPRREDGGYLAALVDACRSEVAALPGRETALPAARRAARRCGEGQSQTHAAGEDGGARLRTWAEGLALPGAAGDGTAGDAGGAAGDATAGDAGGAPPGAAGGAAGDATAGAAGGGAGAAGGAAPGAASEGAPQAPPPYRWWEIAAGAGSSVAAHALIAAAADRRTDAAEAEAIDAAYFPPVGALTVLLDDLVDREADLAAGEHNYLAYYAGAAEAAERLALIGARARGALAGLPRRRRHLAILAGVAAFYLGDPAGGGAYAEPARERLLAALGPTARLALAATRARRRG
jgi:tetraprenyl-beta-curcumene synthase